MGLLNQAEHGWAYLALHEVPATMCCPSPETHSGRDMMGGLSGPGKGMYSPHALNERKTERKKDLSQEDLQIMRAVDRYSLAHPGRATRTRPGEAIDSNRLGNSRNG